MLIHIFKKCKKTCRIWYIKQINQPHFSSVNTFIQLHFIKLNILSINTVVMDVRAIRDCLVQILPKAPNFAQKSIMPYDLHFCRASISLAF